MSDMSRPWEGVTPPPGQRVITGAVFTSQTTAETAYVELVSKWVSAPGLPDLELMGQAYLYQTITDSDGKDLVSITYDVPAYAMSDYSAFNQWLESLDIDPYDTGYAMYTKSFATEFTT